MPSSHATFLVYKIQSVSNIDILGEVKVRPTTCGEYTALSLMEAIVARDVHVPHTWGVRLFLFNELTKRKQSGVVATSTMLEVGKAYCYEFKKRPVSVCAHDPHLDQQDDEHTTTTTTTTRRAVQPPSRPTDCSTSSNSRLYDAIKKAKLEAVDLPFRDPTDAMAQSIGQSSPVLRILTIESPHYWLTDSCASRQCFVRSVYDTLWERVVECWGADCTKITDLLVTGTPGIGKSWALNYLLYQALQLQTKEQHRIVILRSTGGWYTFHKGTCYETHHYLGRSWLLQHGASLEDNRALILHDHAYVHGKSFFDDIDYGPVSIVFASPPGYTNFKAFEHRGRCAMFLMPTWTRAEFMAFASVFLKERDERRSMGEEEWNATVVRTATHEFDTFGGILRKALRGGRPVQGLASDIAIIGASASLPIVTEGTYTDAQADLLQLVPNKEYTRLETVRFLSSKIERLFVQYRRVLFSWRTRIAELSCALRFVLRRHMSSGEFKSCILDALEKHHSIQIDFSNVSPLFQTEQVLSTKIDPLVPTTQPPDLPSIPVADSNNNRLPAISFEERNVSDFINDVIKEADPTTWRVFVPKVPSQFPLFDFMFVKGTSIYGVCVTIESNYPCDGQAIGGWLEQCCDPFVTFQLKGIIFLVDKESKLSTWQGPAPTAGTTDWMNSTAGGGDRLTPISTDVAAAFAAIPQWLLKVDLHLWVK